VNVPTFLDMVDMAHIPGTEQAIAAVRGPFLLAAIYGLYLLLILFFAATAQAEVLPRWGGILTALGIALQVPAQFASNLAGPMFYIFSAGGSIVFGIGLCWIGWALVTGQEMGDADLRLSSADLAWGAPLVMLTGLLLATTASLNTFGGATLLGGIANLFSLTTLLFGIVILFTAQAEHGGALGFFGLVFTHLGAALSIIPAYLMVAQLAGQIDSDRALLTSLVDFPFGRLGGYLLLLGLILFGVSALRASKFPKASAWLFLMGMVLLLPFQFQPQAVLFLVLRILGGTLQGVGLAWMGWSLRKERNAAGGKRLAEV
jgi:hypothetical protein